MIFNFTYLPLCLTLFRLIVSPIIIPFLIVTMLPMHRVDYNLTSAVVFFIFAITDFFDGYIARRYKSTSNIGAFLDPIADKFLVISSLIALVSLQRIYFYWVIIMIGRELLIMSLRQYVLMYGVTLVVSYTAKMKTALQMIMIMYIMLNPYGFDSFWAAPVWNGIEQILVLVSVFLAIISMLQYYNASMRTLSSMHV